MKKILALFMIIASILFLCSCKKAQETRHSFQFDTVINITADKKYSKSVDKAFELCAQYEKIFSRTDKESELFAINNKKAKMLSNEMKNVLDFSLSFSRMTDGAFDITVTPLVELWNVNERSSPPEDAEIKEALKSVGYKKISLSPLNLGESRIDLGGVAKGYIADRLIESFKKDGCKNIIVDLGGNVALIGEYTVGIRNPFSPQEVFATIKLKDKSAVTSGAYQRYFEYKGKKYHHIIDPRTGYPSDCGIASVTVISPSSMKADALSTAIYVMGKDAISLCENFADTDALIITDNGEVITTDNFREKYDLHMN